MNKLLFLFAVILAGCNYCPPPAQEKPESEPNNTAPEYECKVYLHLDAGDWVRLHLDRNMYVVTNDYPELCGITMAVKELHGGPIDSTETFYSQRDLYVLGANKLVSMELEEQYRRPKELPAKFSRTESPQAGID